MKHGPLAFAAVVAFTLPSASAAEVGDKIPSASLLWLGGFASFATCLLAVRFLARWAAWLVSLGALFGAVRGVSVLADSQVGPAALTEHGLPYVAAAVVAPLLGLVGVIAGVWWKRHSKPAAA